MPKKDKNLQKIRLLKLRYLFAILTRQHRVKWLKKHDVFGLLGEHVLYQPWRLPNNPKLIRIHNNVRIASNVTFYEHDGINSVFQHLKPGKWDTHQTCIEIFDNCFIGGNSTIIGNVSIGPNAIVAGGSVVTKDVAPGTIVGGNPAKVIGCFDDLLDKRMKEDYNTPSRSKEERVEYLWNQFYIRHPKEKDNKIQ